MKINLIKPNPNNPRTIKNDKFKKLVQSIQDFPQMLELRPIVIDENNIVLGGNMRLKACQELGLKDVPTIYAKDLTEEQKKEFIIKDNVGFGEWNWDDLANDWDEEKLVEWGLDLPINLETEEQEDLSDDIETNFRIEVILKDEKSQELLYNELIERNYECRLLTL
jgi:ParB-like chromosome segregation protein Spo0J